MRQHSVVVDVQSLEDKPGGHGCTGAFLADGALDLPGCTLELLHRFTHLFQGELAITVEIHSGKEIGTFQLIPTDDAIVVGVEFVESGFDDVC